MYDYRDAEERVSMLREWVDGEPEEDQYEIPDVEGCIPASMKRRSLGRRSLREVKSRVKGKEAKSLLDGAIELARISEQADRPELTDEMREEMGDMNPPLPGLLAVFKPEDAIEGCFDRLSRELGLQVKMGRGQEGAALGRLTEGGRSPTGVSRPKAAPADR